MPTTRPTNRGFMSEQQRIDLHIFEQRDAAEKLAGYGIYTPPFEDPAEWEDD